MGGWAGLLSTTVCQVFILYFYLNSAARSGHVDIIEYLLSSDLGAQVDIRDQNNLTPLMIACGVPSSPELVRCVKLLLTNGADPNATEDGGYIALQYAILNGIAKREYLF